MVVAGSSMTLYIRWFALATLVAGSLSASVPDQDGTGATDRTLMFSTVPGPGPAPPTKPWECPLPEYKQKKGPNSPTGFGPTCDPTRIGTENAHLTEPRERKEWREMNTTEINRFACALRVMDETTTKEGRACYGKTFWAFADLVNLHACAAADPRGDQGHRSPSFMLFHKSFVRTFEMAILSIDPNIEAIPWWNMPLDSAPVLFLNGTEKVPAGKYYKDCDPKKTKDCDPKKYIWTDKYFGKQTGSGPNFEVADGRWAYRKLHRYGDFDHEYWSTYPPNPNGDPVTKPPVTNECVVGKWFSPRSPKVGKLRKQKEFDDNLDQNCVRCCNGQDEEHGQDPTCKCNQTKDYVDVYMRGPTLDTATCSPYVTRNPNGRGVGTVKIGNEKQFDGNGRSDQDSLLRYTQHDFDACANSNNTRNWIEWQNCQEENLFGTLEGVYCPADKETCTQSELEKVFALHSSAHDKTLGEIGDVTTSPSDPALFFSYHAYIDKNFMVWQESMMDTGRFTDPVKKDLGHHDQSDPPDLTNKNYFGYPRNVKVEDWQAHVDEFVNVQFIDGMVKASNQRMTLRNWVAPVSFDHFDLQLWQDLLGKDGQTQWMPPGHQNSSLAEQWHDAATMNDTDAKMIYQVHAGVDPKDHNVYNVDHKIDTEDFLGPACSSLTNVWGETNDAEKFTNAKDETARGVFNPLFSSNCDQPTFPSPQPGSLTHNLTQCARTYSTSGPFIYMTKYRPPDFFNRGRQANPTLPWIPGTLLQDIALGGLPFRNLFPTDDGGEFGYSNKEIIELSMPCLHGRAPNNKTAPCSPYYYSKGE